MRGVVPAAFLSLLALSLSACPGLVVRPPAGTLDLGSSPTSSPQENIGGGILFESATPGPATTSTPGASQAPSPAPTERPSGPFVLDIQVIPDRATVGMAPPIGATPLLDHTFTFKVQITLNNGLQVTSADWISSDPSLFTVDPSGRVTALAKPGEGFVTAVAKDGSASASARVNVVDHAGVGVLIE